MISQCLYPNLDNCASFWQCSNGVPYLKVCPGGLEYNDFIKVCDWPSDQTCRPGLQPTPEPTTAPNTTDGTTEVSTEPSTGIPIETESPITTTELTTGASTDDTLAPSEPTATPPSDEIAW